MSSLQKFHRRTNPFKVNTLHTGTVSISGTAESGKVLSVTSTIADVDGLGTFAYQWKRSGSAISGATSSTYTLVSADVGNTITVTITYTDGKGFAETETSAATATVIVPNPFPTIGSGGTGTTGQWVGTTLNSSKLIMANSITGTAWGSNGTIRGTTSVTDGLSNTNTLYSFGQAAHPAAYAVKSMTQGGYNTWYIACKNELINMYSAQQSSSGAIVIGGLWVMSSTEQDATTAFAMNTGNNDGRQGGYGKSSTASWAAVIPVRRY